MAGTWKYCSADAVSVLFMNGDSSICATAFLTLSSNDLASVSANKDNNAETQNLLHTTLYHTLTTLLVGFISITHYQFWIHLPCDIASPRDRTISYRNARLARALLARTDQMHIPAITTSGTVISKARIYGQLVTGCCRWPCLLTHILFDLYFAHSTYSQVSTSSLFKSSRWRRRQRWGSRASWVAGTAMPFPPHTVSGQQTSDSGKLVDNIGQHVSCYLNYPEWNGNHTLISDLPNLWRLVDDVAVAY